MRFKKIWMLFVFLLFSLFFVTPNIHAAEIAVETHTPGEIRKYLKDHNVKTDGITKFDESPVTTGPNYVLGELSDETTNSALATLNAVRYIAGLNADITVDSDYQKKAQGAALIDAVTDTLTHYPTKPADMNSELFEICQQGGRKTNLGLGYDSLNSAIVDGWMSDRDPSNIEMVGHRRWILNPKMKKTGFGVATGKRTFSAMYAHDASNSDIIIKGVAWPAQNTPISFFSRNNEPWSVSMGVKQDISKIKVELKRVSDGKIWKFSQSDTTDGDFYVNNGGYGQTGCIIFRPTLSSSEKYKDGDRFEVKITGLYNDNTQSYDEVLRYSVYFFDGESDTKISLSENNVSINEEGEKKITATVYPLDVLEQSSEGLSCKIEDDTIATVQVSGTSITVTGKKAGKTKLIVSFGGKEITCPVTVNHVPGAAATCDTPQKCTICETVLVEAKGHDYSQPEFTFAENYKQAIATFTCKECKKQEKENAIVTSKETAATCTVNGKIEYTATVMFNNVQYTGTAIVSIDKIGHNYQAEEIVFSTDYNVANLKLVCEGCDDIKYEPASVQISIIEATCTQNGKKVYTAMATFGEKEYRAIKETILPATHKFGSPVFIFKEDYSSAEAIFNCEKCEVYETRIATVTSQTQQPTYYAEGKTVYKATVDFNGIRYTKTETVTIPKLVYPNQSTTSNTGSVPNEVNDNPPVKDSGAVVQEKPIRLEGISNKIAVGKTIRLNVVNFPFGKNNLTWISSNPALATVDKNGTVTLSKKAKGKNITITVTAKNGQRATFTIKGMKGIVKKISIIGKQSVKAGKKIKLKAKVKATKGANKKLKWISSNTEYATVSASGKVKTKKSGKGKKVKITAMATDGSNKKKTITIQIK